MQTPLTKLVLSSPSVVRHSASAVNASTRRPFKRKERPEKAIKDDQDADYAVDPKVFAEAHEKIRAGPARVQESSGPPQDGYLLAEFTGVIGRRGVYVSGDSCQRSIIDPHHGAVVLLC